MNANGWRCRSAASSYLCSPQLKLEGYKKRLRRGEALNSDQMVRLRHGNGCHVLVLVQMSSSIQVAVEKYEEVLHHLQFAQELHKTLDGLTMNVSLQQPWTQVLVNMFEHIN